MIINKFTWTWCGSNIDFPLSKTKIYRYYMADKELVLFAVHCVLLLFIPLYFEGLARDWQGIGKGLTMVMTFT